MTKTKTAMSLEGWEFGKWLRGNWTTIKEMLKVGIPAIVSWVTTTDPVLGGAIVIIGKFLLDMGEYYLKPRELE